MPNPISANEITIKPQKLETVIYKESGTIYYDEKGNIVTDASTGKYTKKTVENNLSDLNVNAVRVENEKGSSLPSTGGIGTTVFRVVGGVLIVGAGVLLISKKRMKKN